MLVPKQVVVVPCSGCKSLGSVTREQLISYARPCVPAIHVWSRSRSWSWEMQKHVARAHRPQPSLLMAANICAQQKLVKHDGGVVAREVAAFECFRNHKDLNPKVLSS